MLEDWDLLEAILDDGASTEVAFIRMGVDPPPSVYECIIRRRREPYILKGSAATADAAFVEAAFLWKEAP